MVIGADGCRQACRLACLSPASGLLTGLAYWVCHTQHRDTLPDCSAPNGLGRDGLPGSRLPTKDAIVRARAV